jgi:hypothetical protein
MWTLVIVVLAFSGGLTGATSSTAFLDFTTRKDAKPPPRRSVFLIGQALLRRPRASNSLLAAIASSPSACSAEGVGFGHARRGEPEGPLAGPLVPTR